ncbi:hypothetical protein CSW98_10340 [Vibrio sp. HA2012]|nr:hypothetical protein CSW98_10340 [Vibrio sp. HA2012]
MKDRKDKAGNFQKRYCRAEYKMRQNLPVKILPLFCCLKGGDSMVNDFEVESNLLYKMMFLFIFKFIKKKIKSGTLLVYM